MPAKKFVVPFASTGNKTAVPNTLQPDGTVSYAQGFGPDYELDKTVDPVNAKDVPRAQTNQLYYDLTDAVGEQQLYGVALWGADRAPYPLNARAYHTGKLWRSNVANNNGEPGVSGWDDVSVFVPPVSTDGIAGSFSNLKASATGTNATVTVTADAICLKNASNEQVVVNALALAINSATVGANGLDTGALAASTWYAVWVIWNGTNAAGLFSLSATAPTLPVGYTHKARVGWIYSDSTPNKYPLAFVQSGRSVDTAVVTGSNTTSYRKLAGGVQGNPVTPTWVAVAVGQFVPSTASSIKVMMDLPPSVAQSIVAPSNSHGGWVGGTSINPPAIGAAASSSFGIMEQCVMVLRSSNIYYASNSSTGSLWCIGWEDNL